MDTHPPTISISGLVAFVRRLLTDPRYFWLLAALIIAGDAVLTELIIRVVPYTEIDWKTYMIQTDVYLKGERDYSNISGPTGPLVYPAGHVHIHHFLHDLTSNGANVRLAQHIYAALYILSLVLTCGIYSQAGIPNWALFILPLSKRLHSIYVLRLFNDCWSVVAVQAAVFAYQLGRDDIGTLLFSAALSVKMSALLYLPGVLVILFLRRGLFFTIRKLVTMVGLQILVAMPFLREDWQTYLHSAFEFSRVFLYKWTVNWRFIPEDIFLSPQLAKGLLLGHVSVLVCFGLFRWCNNDGGVWSVLERGLRRPHLPAALVPLSADYVATVLFTSNLIGILFARSLHYQFYSWYAHQIPLLLWRIRFPVVFKIAVIGAIEYAWNVFPSTRISSAVLLASNALLLLGIWFEDASGISRKPIPQRRVES